MAYEVRGKIPHGSPRGDYAKACDICGKVVYRALGIRKDAEGRYVCLDHWRHGWKTSTELHEANASRAAEGGSVARPATIIGQGGRPGQSELGGLPDYLTEAAEDDDF